MLYSLEEICKGCKYLVTHYCELCTDGPKFCHCKIGAEGAVDFASSKCKSKIPLTENLVKEEK